MRRNGQNEQRSAWPVNQLNLRLVAFDVVDSPLEASVAFAFHRVVALK